MSRAFEGKRAVERTRHTDAITGADTPKRHADIKVTACAAARAPHVTRRRPSRRLSEQQRAQRSVKVSSIRRDDCSGSVECQTQTTRALRNETPHDVTEARHKRCVWKPAPISRPTNPVKPLR